MVYISNSFKTERTFIESIEMASALVRPLPCGLQGSQTEEYACWKDKEQGSR